MQIIIILFFSFFFGILHITTIVYNDSGSKTVEESYQAIKNYYVADSQLELNTLKNKRFFDIGDSSVLQKDIRSLSKDELKTFIKTQTEKEYVLFEDELIRKGRVGTYKSGQRGTDINVVNTTKRIVKNDETDKLNTLTNHLYDIPLNANIKYLSDNSNTLFSTLRIRWGEPNQNANIQLSLYRFPINSSIGINRDSLLTSWFSNEKSQSNMAKRIIKTTDGDVKNSNSIKDLNTSNPQEEYFDKIITIGDIISGTNFDPKNFLYVLSIESLNQEPLPIMIEALNSSGIPVGFVGDYTISIDVTGEGGEKRRRLQLVQNISFGRMKYFNKSLFSGEDIIKEVSR